MKREVPSLKAALSGSSTIGVIAEFVRKTPALGWINKDAKITGFAKAKRNKAV